MQVFKVVNLQTISNNSPKKKISEINYFNTKYQQSSTDTVSFGVNKIYSPNQILPSTDKLIQRAVKKISVEKTKIVKGLEETWDAFAMGKKSSIYIGHREAPLDKNQIDYLQDLIQLTGNIEGKKRVSLSNRYPNKFLLYIDQINSNVPKHSNDITYDIDYTIKPNGMITEFVGDNMTPETKNPTEIKKLNERVQYYLKALFPKKEVK